MPTGHLDALPYGVASVECPPHVSQGLSVAGSEAIKVSRQSFHVAANVTLTGCGVYYADLQVTGKGKEAFQVHVHVLTDGAWTRVPAANVLEQSHG